MPPTKEGSYQAANAWWIAKRAELDGLQPPHKHSNYLAALYARLAWAQRNGHSHIAERLAVEIARIEQGGLPSYLQTDDSFLDEPPPQESDCGDEPPLEVIEQAYLEEQASRAIDPADPIWNDRVANDKLEKVPDDRRVSGQLQTWLAMRRAKVTSDGLSAKGYDNLVDCLNHFRDWVGAESDVAVINPQRWHGYWLHVSKRVTSKIWSRDYASKVFRTARIFVEWLGKMDLIPIPKNLYERDYRFRKPIKKVTPMSVEEFQRLVENATGQLQLHLLLMANCGMTQKDFSDLRQSEVDWEEGRIIRKRSKTGDSENVPTVNYKLWPRTWELLLLHRSGDRERVLLTRSGRPWAGSHMDGEKPVSADSFRSNYVRLQRKLGFRGQPKVIRKTSASMLDSHREYGRYVGHFLGHSPTTIRDKHYVKPSDKQFDKAIEWLGRQYGLFP